MARAFPLDRDTFQGALPIWEQTFDLAGNMEVSGLGDGSILTDEIGPRLWRGRCDIDLLPMDQARPVSALMSLLQGPGRSFLAWRLDCAAPAFDPGGTILSGYAPFIHSLPSDARELTLGGLPGGYAIGPGDMLSFTYGSSPTRYALHRVVSDQVTASGSGMTPTLEVVPPIRPGAVVSAAVELIRPCCKALLVPVSVTPGTLRRNKLRGVSFEFIQTLR
jgi:hypothetical protein